jgi:methionine-rich copper-binding protein CopC
VDKKDRLIMRVSLQPLTAGTYKVEWRVLSVDGHKVNGDFTFTVGEQGADIGLPRGMAWLTR